MEKLIKREKIYSGKIVNLVKDTVKIKNKKTIREIILHPGSSVIIPVFNIKKKEVILIKQFRYAASSYIYELPAGTKEKGENFLNCAKRELIEETGYSAKHIKKIITFYPSPGVMTEKMNLFLAYNLIKEKINLKFDEDIKIKILSLDKIINLIYKGKIIDAKTLTGIFILKNIFEDKKLYKKYFSP